MDTREWPVAVKESRGPLIAGRLCALRKSAQAIEQAQQKVIATARKKQTQCKPETLEFAKYVIVFSTFPQAEFSTEALLEWYRLRWQVELAFKRLKSLLEMGHLPKYDPRSARAWLYGKLFLALLTEKLARITRAFSPGATICRSRWRKFEFIWHQIEHAIVPVLLLEFILQQWPEIAVSLGERPRQRSPQIDTFDFAKFG